MTVLSVGVGRPPAQVCAWVTEAATRRALATIRLGRETARRCLVPVMLGLPVGGLLIGCSSWGIGSVFPNPRRKFTAARRACACIRRRVPPAGYFGWIWNVS